MAWRMNKFEWYYMYLKQQQQKKVLHNFTFIMWCFPPRFGSWNPVHQYVVLALGIMNLKKGEQNQTISG